ncbi:polysaccharide pyruvyl transferase WcaK-like protein [Arthrobacter pigmenti]|uniref:Polysaccharide pyruvyl transferase WcaK-like protein n=1 Tax=Arthrobacter pigmenti TaxID=271432 RepID=A0A846RL92_9MICC|nr:polysaccharide pyruvyl transferase WcaK-like protein [Arthrobacter pigmenti]
MKPSLVYLISCAGHPNFGDEMIAAGWLRLLAERYPETDVWLDCPNPGTAELLFEGIHPRVHFTNTLWRLCWDAHTQRSGDIAGYVSGKVRNFGSPFVDLGIEKLRQADSLHLLGGGYLNAIWPANAGLIAAMATAQELTGCKLFGTGLSLVPFNEDAAHFENAFEKFDYVSVRDAPSAERYGIRQGLDDAFLSIEHEVERGLARNDDADLVVCLQPDQTTPEEFEAAVQTARPVVQAALEAGQVVKYVEGIPGTDHAGFDALKDLIPVENFIPFSSVWKDGLPLRENQTWVTTRFHLHFAAAAAGAHGMAIGVKENYYDIKHGTLLELGTGWAYGTHTSPPEEPMGGTAFRNGLRARVAEKRVEAERLYPVVAAPEEIQQEPKPRWLERLRR